MNKRTLVLGASPNPERYSNIAIHRLVSAEIPTFAVGMRKGIVAGVEIQKELIEFPEIDTITLYMNAEVQKMYIDYMLSLHPKRIIFNPGTENPVFERLAADQKIEVVRGCTLVMLSVGTY